MSHICGNSSVALQLIDSSGLSSSVCRTFDGLPLAAGVQICVAAENGLLSKAQQLFDSVESVIANVSPSASSNNCMGATALNCARHKDPDILSVLVPVLADQPASHAMQNLIAGWLLPNLWNKRVLPVLPVGTDPSHVLSPPLDKLIVLREPKLMADLVPDILRSSGIGSEAFRLFISYRRVDAQALADQLFEAFAQVGFDVFLDRFRGVPGRYFPQLLEESLIDKGMVVVIESPDVQRSPWTCHEVQFARNFRLGLMALPMPGGAPFGTIPPVDRWNDGSNPRKWEDGCGNTPNSRLIAPDAFVEFVRRRFAFQTLQRRIYLEASLQLALASESLPSTRQANGAHIIKSSWREYSVVVSARPPSLEETRRVCEAAQSPGCQRALLGPTGYLPPESHANMSWTAKQLRTALRDAGQMRRLAQDIRNQRSMP